MIPLRVYYQNASGMRTKVKQVHDRTASAEFKMYDVYVIVESWLHPGIDSSEIFNPQLYTVYRLDRDPTTGFRKGGGVLIAVRSKFRTRRINLKETGKWIEQLCVSIDLSPIQGSELLVVGNYIRGTSKVRIFEKFIRNIREVAVTSAATDRTTAVLVVGDFNVPTILRSKENQVVKQRKKYELISSLEALNLCQYNSIHNERRALLDLVFANKYIRTTVEAAKNPLMRNCVHHTALGIEMMLERVGPFGAGSLKHL